MRMILDRLARTEVRFLGRACSSFQVCGLAGLSLGTLLGVVLAVYLGLSLWVLAAILVAAIGTFLTLAMITKIILGREILVYYHHEVAILGTTTLLLWLLRQPVLAYLDVTILGVGTLLIFGRAGCFLVGCCHGLPHHWGVCYGKAHAEAGFTRYLAGVRLFPIQLVESAWVLGSVAGGVYLIRNGSVPGEAMAWYVITYGVGRFCFEFLRGDPDRRYRLGFTEGQWTSLALMLAVAGSELKGALSLHSWHVAAAAGVAATMIAIAVSRRYRPTVRHRLLHPHHIREVAGLLERLALPAQAPLFANGERSVEIAVGRTTAGIQLSAGTIERDGDRLDHYTFSAGDGRLEQRDARALADLILELKHQSGLGDLVPGQRGIFHLLANRPHAVESQ